MDRVSRCVRAAWVAGLVSLWVVVGSVPARAAFPGANGLLVVQPANERGLLLVGEDGANPLQVCGVGSRCFGATDPVWSPDGSEIAVSVRHRTSVIYPDGSCFACSLPEPSNGLSGNSVPTFDPGFLPDGRLVVSTRDNSPASHGPGVAAMKTDGVGVRWLSVSVSWQQPAWSASGQLAAVRLVKRKSEVFVIDPRTGSARQLTRGGASSPSWSPDGRRLAVVEGGWIALVSSRGGRLRRLTRGGAPAWAPDGQELAFVGAHHRLFVIAVQGGAPRAVGQLRAVRVDWQSVTGRLPSPCQAPAGSSVLAATPNAIVTIDVSQPRGDKLLSVLGCLASDGHERLLENMATTYDGGSPEIGPVAIAGDYVALVTEYRDGHYGGSFNWLTAFDLRTGTSISSGQQANCEPDLPGITPCESSIDQVAVSDIDGATAAHTIVVTSDAYPSCTLTEQIVATDSTGTHILDRVTTNALCDGPPPVLQLSQLSLLGHTLTWSHAGSPRSAQLN
jgi:Tol biopolymer transport system component